jgi:GNAT superfamily N-acetyltransferase
VIRPATLADVPRLVAMGLRFRRESPYAALFAENVDQLTDLAERLVTGEASTMLVEARGGAVLGMIGLTVYPESFSGVPVCGEVAFWVEPEARGAGVGLVRAAEAWAQAHGCQVLHLGAPDARVETFYERLGYVPVERSYHRRLDAPRQPRFRQTLDPNIVVIDDVLTDPHAYRAAALAGSFEDQQVGDDLFRGIQLAPAVVGDWLQQRTPSVRVTLSFFRQSPADQAEPHYVHSDAMMGQWTGILYLNPDPPQGDGTAFYEHRDGARLAELEALPRYAADFDDDDAWVRWLTRLLLFPAVYFHARALRDNYGTGDDARLVQVLFGGYDHDCLDSHRDRAGRGGGRRDGAGGPVAVESGQGVGGDSVGGLGARGAAAGGRRDEGR